MSIEETGEQWEVADDWVGAHHRYSVVCRTREHNRIIADNMLKADAESVAANHNAASSLEATLTRAQTADTWQDWKKLTDQATANANEWMARAQTAEAALEEADKRADYYKAFHEEQMLTPHTSAWFARERDEAEAALAEAKAALEGIGCLAARGCVNRDPGTRRCVRCEALARIDPDPVEALARIDQHPTQEAV